MLIGLFAPPETKNLESAIKACENLNIDYVVIDLFDFNWLEQVKKNNEVDGYLIIPPAMKSIWRVTFFKRLNLLRPLISEKPSLPSVDDVLFYESKISMHDFYQINGIPHVPSYTFFKFNQAWKFASEAALPLINKTDGGSGSVGVVKIDSRVKLKWNVLKSFFISNKPGKNQGLKNKLKQNLYPLVFYRRSGKEFYPKKDKENSYIHLQKAIKIKYEWRVVKIGESYFAHNKVENKQGFHSGTGNTSWEIPPLKVFDFVHKIAFENNIQSMAFDIFQDENDKLYVNEMQVLFGTKADNQMYKDGVPGRFILKEGRWTFEEGIFGDHACNKLRLKVLTTLVNCKFIS